jgi:hypothetical protein
MIRKLRRMIDGSRADTPRRRVVIGRAANGTPRTYRLVRRPGGPARAALELLATLAVA